MIHVYTILLSYKKEQNYAICPDMDGPRDSQGQVSQKEEKNILY